MDAQTAQSSPAFSRDELLATKLNVPRALSALVPRPRLIERLDAGLRGRLTLISAPAGSGKTTLVSDWAGQCGRPMAWLCLEESDNDPIRFLAYLTAALQTVEPDVGAGVLEALHSPRFPPAESVLTTLINDVSEASNPFVLVLDDYHRIVEQHVHDAVAYLLEHTPENMHLVITTRSDPPLPIPLLRGRGQVTALGAADLSFTTEEVTDFLNRVMGLRLSSDAVAALAHRTEGWIAGLQLAAVSLQGKDGKDAMRFVESFTGSHRYVLDYLAEEVLSRQPENVLSFLLQTSVLNQLTASLCNAVTGRDDGQECLERIERANLFVVPLDDVRRWYRYHHLFSDLLRQRLHAEQPDLEIALHGRASVWYEENDFLASAIDHALAAGDFERAVRLLESVAAATWGRGEHATLMRWLARLPADVLCSTSMLCVYHALVLFTGGDYALAERRLVEAERAAQGCPEEGFTRERQGMIDAVRAYIAFFRGEFYATVHFSRQALESLPEDNLTWQGMANYTLGLALRWSGDLEGADQALSKAARSSQAAGMSYLTLLIHANLAAVQEQRGRLRRAHHILHEALQLAEEKGMLQTAVGGLLQAELANILTEWNQLDEAMRLLKSGLALNKRGQDVGFLGWCYVYMARLLCAMGDVDGGLAAVDVMEKLSQRVDVPPVITNRLVSPRMREWLARGDLDAAARYFEERGMGVDDEITYVSEPAYLWLARLLAAQGQWDEAEKLLERLLRFAEAKGREDWVIKTLTAWALTANARGDRSKAMALLARALSLAEPEGYVRVFISEGKPMGELLHATLSEGTHVQYVRRLLAAFESPALETRPAKQPFVEPLSEREMEVLRLLATSLSGAEIADRLFVAVSTVRSHTKSIYSKLGVHRRVDAVDLARELKLI